MNAASVLLEAPGLGLVYALVWASAASFLGYVIAGDLALIRDAYKAIRCGAAAEPPPVEPWRTARSEVP